MLFKSIINIIKSMNGNNMVDVYFTKTQIQFSVVGFPYNSITWAKAAASCPELNLFMMTSLSLNLPALKEQEGALSPADS